MNDEIEFLSFAEVLQIHSWQIKNFGGQTSIRDINLLKSGLAMPAATFNGIFLHSDIYEMAAAYMFHLIKNHPFIDGNKRVGTMAALVFLKLNAVEFTTTNDELTEKVMNIAQGKINKAEIALFLKEHSVPQ